MKKKFKILLLMITPLVLSGCNKKNDVATFEVKHQYGITKVPLKAERIITLKPGDFETALALGVKPIATGATQNFNCVGGEKCNIKPWVQKILDEDPNYKPEYILPYAMTDSIHFERLTYDEQEEELEKIDLNKKEVKKLNPDLIIAPFSTMDKGEYDTLSKIAPTVPSLYDFSQNQCWQDATRLVATCLNKREEGEKLITDIEELINSKVKEFPNLLGKKVVFIKKGGKEGISCEKIMGENYYYVNFLESLDLEIDPNVENILIDKTHDFITTENVNMLESVDIIITNSTSYSLEELKTSKTLSNNPAILKESVVCIPEGMYEIGIKYPTILSIPYFLDEYLNLLNEAALKC